MRDPTIARPNFAVRGVGSRAGRSTQPTADRRPDHLTITSGREQIGRLAPRWDASHVGAMAADVTIYAALIAGLVSFLSPCELPLVPPYLAYLAGASLQRLAGAEPPPHVRRDTVVAALLFVAGFSTVFVALGASASIVGALL